ncbi:MAG: phytoene/squalene synthase family protein [Pseudomonadota bacterium]
MTAVNLHNYDWLETKACDMEVCRQMLREGSHSFYAASLLLPADVREPACALYAFCRLADDVIDDGDADNTSVAGLTRRIDMIYGGDPFDHPADRAMVQLADLYYLPRELPDALVDGFRWDVEARRYDTLDQLYGYAARVAGSVGAMMAVLMGGRDPAVLARACDLGVAMQLTNIARDVGEDARNGRLYLPREWMREAGLDPDAWLARPQFSAALGGVIAKLLEAADALYLRARSGIAQLPVGCRPGIYAAMRIYREIGVELRRRNLDSVTQRTVVSRGRKSFLLGHAMLSTLSSQPLDKSPALPQTQYLVDAVHAAGDPPPAHVHWFA